MQYSNATSTITNGPLKVAHSSPGLWPCPVQYVPAWHATHENADVTLPASPNSQQYIQDHHIDIPMVGGGAWTNFQTMTRWRVWKIQCDSGLWCVCRLYVKIIYPRPAVFGSSFRSVFRARSISCISNIWAPVPFEYVPAKHVEHAATLVAPAPRPSNSTDPDYWWQIYFKSQNIMPGSHQIHQTLSCDMMHHESERNLLTQQYFMYSHDRVAKMYTRLELCVACELTGFFLESTGFSPQQLWSDIWGVRAEGWGLKL